MNLTAIPRRVDTYYRHLPRYELRIEPVRIAFVDADTRDAAYAATVISDEQDLEVALYDFVEQLPDGTWWDVTLL